MSVWAGGPHIVPLPLTRLTTPKADAPHIAHFAMCGFRRDRRASRSHSHYAAWYSDYLPERYYPNPRVKWSTRHPHIRKERECVGHPGVQTYRREWGGAA